jgi:hypothetical protein
MILECKSCSAIVDAKVIATHDDGGDYDPNGSMIEPPGRWTFASCPRCQNPMLAVQCDFGEGFGSDTPTRLFPPEDKRRQLGWTVPETLQIAFNEAVICFKSKAFTASAIMCRKTLEGLCAEHGVKGTNLSQSLKKLRDKQVIEERLFEWAEALRTLGNEAAHGVDCSISREDCEDTLDFTEALVQYVFTYQDQFKRFRERRGNSSTAKKASSDSGMLSS